MIEDNYTQTSTYAESTLQAANGTVLPGPVAISARVFQIIYGSVHVVFGLLLNVLILILVFRFKKLRTISSGIAVQIAIADLALTITYGIPTVVNHIAGDWVLGLEFCIISGFILLIFSSLRTLLIFVFSFDRFASVFAPFFYPKHSHRITILMCVLAWSIGAAISLVIIPPILDCYVFSEPALYCTYSSRCSRSCTAFSIILYVTIIIPTMFMPVGFFIALYFKGRKIRRKESKMLGLTRKSITDQEWRALKTFFMLLLAVFLVTFPPTLFATISSSFGTVARSLAVQLASDIITLLVITDPIIIMRNADFKEAFNNLMKPFMDVCVRKRRQPNVAAEQKHQGQTMELSAVE